MTDTRAVDPVADEVPASSRPTVSLGWVVGAVVVLVGVLIGIQPLRDNSFFTHLATGRLIVDTGSIPTADPYSYTALGEPWTVQSWLASVLYAVVEDVGGLVGLRVLMAATTAALAAGVWLITRPAPSIFVRLGLAGAALVIGTERWSERPLLFGLLGMVAVLLALDGRIRAAWIVPVTVLWVNVHGSFPLAVALVAAVAVGERLDGRVADPTRAVARNTVIGLAVAAVLPYGLRLLSFPFRMLDRREVFAEIREWQPAGLSEPTTWALVGLALAAVVVWRGHRSWRLALPAAAFTLFALTSARNLTVASLVLVALIARERPALGSLTSDRPVAARLRPVLLVLIALVVVVGLSRPDVNLKGYPVEAVDWLEARGAVGSDGDPAVHLASRDFVGNYLEARYGTDARVFIDDRYDMYPVDLALDYIGLVDGRDVAAALDRHDANVVLWERESDVADALAEAPAWGRVYEDADWFIACRVELGATVEACAP